MPMVKVTCAGKPELVLDGKSAEGIADVAAMKFGSPGLLSLCLEDGSWVVLAKDSEFQTTEGAVLTWEPAGGQHSAAKGVTTIAYQ